MTISEAETKTRGLQTGDYRDFPTEDAAPTKAAAEAEKDKGVMKEFTQTYSSVTRSRARDETKTDQERNAETVRRIEHWES